MLKKLVLLTLFFFSVSILSAQPGEKKKTAVGIMGGFYFMQDEVFQESYGKSALFLGAEIPFSLPLKSFKNLEGTFIFRYLNDKGKTSLTEEEIKLNLVFFSFSLRYVMSINKFMPFFGPGIDYILYKEKYPETFPVESMNGSTFGFHVQGGSYFHLSSSLSAILYFKYNIAKTVKEEVKVNLGGTEWALGLVYYF